MSKRSIPIASAAHAPSAASPATAASAASATSAASAAAPAAPAAAPESVAPPLTPKQRRTLRAAAALVIPATADFGGLPGADDETIATDIERTMGRDRPAVMGALEKLDAAAGGPLADQPAAQREAAGRGLREHEPALANTFASLVVACYYRDDRVMRSLGLEPRPPYPQGFEVEPGDYAAMLAPVRARGRLWRGVVEGAGE